MFNNSTRLFKISVFVLGLFITPCMSHAQDSLHNVNQQIADSHCSAGKGNGTFKITLSQLEAVFLKKYNQKTFIKTLPKYACQDKLSFNGDLKTGDWDIPDFEFDYTYVNKNFEPTGIYIQITILGNINNKIRSLRIDGISAKSYDALLRQLKKICLFRGSLSNSYEQHFVDKATSRVIILYKKGPGDYSIFIV